MAGVLGLAVRTTFDGPVDTELSPVVLEQLLATLREAVANIGRHAGATEVSVSLSVQGSLCRLLVSDDGRGMPPGASEAGGHGLVNMRHRAERLHGQLVVSTNPSGGTTLDWRVMTR